MHYILILGSAKMSRDKDIQHVFEIADDSLQGVLGYHLYVIAIQLAANSEKVLENLPADRIPITFSWDRFYQKQDLLEAFKLPVFQIYQSRISLIAIVNVFEVALEGFIRHLNSNGHPQYLGNRKLKEPPLKQCIQWAYEQLFQCDIGDTEAIKRLPTTFGIIDNARRLRNLIVHNQGLFDDGYEKDAINSNGIVVDLHPGYSFSKTNPQRPVPIIMGTGDFLEFTKAHIEVLHLLHNFIQKKYFGFQKAYDYIEEKKAIEWDKVLWGSAKVRVHFTEIRD
jgi:hypothetical protein